MWTKEQVGGGKDFGFRRADGLGYVGKSAGGWWRAYVRLDADADFEPVSRHGYPAAEMAKSDVDQLLEGLVAA